MKWPNLVKVDEVLKERDIHATALEDRSSDAMSYFTGIILPGVTMPWLIMNTLIDCDVDAGVNALAALTLVYCHILALLFSSLMFSQAHAPEQWLPIP